MISNIIKNKIIPAFLGVIILSFGFFSYSVGFILISFNTVISNRRFNWSALLMAFFIGTSVDLFNAAFSNAINIDSPIVNIVIFIMGIILYGLGIAFLIYSNMPSPLEEYQFAIQKVFKV